MLAGYESSEQKEEMSLCLYVNMDCMSMHKTCMYYTQGSSSGISKKKLSGHVVPGRVVGAWASGSLIKKKNSICLLTKEWITCKRHVWLDKLQKIK